MNNTKKILLLGVSIGTVMLTSSGGNKETETPAVAVDAPNNSAAGAGTDTIQFN